ncbi:hypothetical protein NDU88_004783 [Pleurodeles waltl]|uniref:Uncharacterized protein n=1 Tax=Pleurodeles waltl TaxID=8319 RepID=A0AAV7WSX9_PLEWA|nr:hypothetical protein NDU88_004783 [Pleurodeles waltl]
MPPGDGYITPRVHEAPVPPSVATTREWQCQPEVGAGHPLLLPSAGVLCSQVRRPRLTQTASARPQADSAKALSARPPQVNARHRWQPQGAMGSPT